MENQRPATARCFSGLNSNDSYTRRRTKRKSTRKDNHRVGNKQSREHALRNSPHEARPKGKEHPLTTIPQATQELSRILDRLSRLKPLPPVWDSLETFNDDDKADRVKLYHDNKRLVHRIEAAVTQGHLNPSRKHGRELSHLLGQALSVYAEIPLDEVYKDCRHVLVLLDTWNLSLHPKHYEQTIQAAARQGLWKEAADLFAIMVDPDVSGYTPMEVSVENPVGLYAIAKYAHSENSAVAEHAMDAVQSMIMVSPTDQDKYVLAAGTALGRAGEYAALLDYLKHSYNSSSLGQSLVAAAMHACILCSRPEKAMELYEELIGGPLSTGSEWQWGGGSYALDPLCRDLAMRVIGSEPDKSELAIELFQQVENDGLQISLEAVQGVIEACEHDRNWDGAFSVFMSLLDSNGERIANGNDLSIVHWDEAEPFCRPHDFASKMRSMLASVLRTCNASREHGLAFLTCRLFELSRIGSSLLDAPDQDISVDQPLLPLLLGLDDADELLVAIMTTLCGLRCHDKAAALYEEIDSISEIEVSSDAYECYRYVASLPLSVEGGWEGTQRHIHRLTSVLADLSTQRELQLSTQQEQLVISALARTMQCCTAAGQPRVSLILAQRTQQVFDRSMNNISTIQGAVSTFFGLEDEKSSEENILHTSDSVLAETIRAYREAGLNSAALSLFESICGPVNDMENSTLPTNAIQSMNEGIVSLAQERSYDEAIACFRAINPPNRTTNTYLSLAKGLSGDGRSDNFGDSYRLALKSGCLSEELALITMKYVAEETFDGKLRVLRGIVKDAARVAGTEKRKWLESRYWTLKRMIGWHHTRLLMWWNDEQTGLHGELALALKQFEERRLSGLKPKNDVVRAIIRHAKDADRFNETHASAHDDTEDSSMLLHHPDDWVNALLHVLSEVEHSSLWNDPNFVDDVAVTLRRLAANAECVDFVSDAASRGVRVGRVAVEEARRAADATENATINGVLELLLAEDANI